MPMTPLARSIYTVLRQQVPAAPNTSPAITYGELVRVLPARFRLTGADDPRLDAALGEIVDACRSKGFPALPAIVVRRDLRVPGAGYYARAHPHAHGDRPTEMLGWVYEFWAVASQTYPARL